MMIEEENKIKSKDGLDDSGDQSTDINIMINDEP